MRDGKVVINSSDEAMAAYSKTVQQTNRTTTIATAGTKALSVAMKVLSSIGWMIVITAITEAIGWVVREIDEAIVTADEAREKSTELTQAWKEESDSLNNLISRYQELSSSLDNANLSESEQLSIKQDLSSIQDTLNKKYKDEVKDIDLVTGKYEEQLTTLKELSKEKARDYVRENEDNIEKEKDYLYENVEYNNSSGAFHFGDVVAKGQFDSTPTKSLDEVAGFNLSDILSKYRNVSAEYSKDLGKYYLKYSGKRLETYEELKALYDELLDYQEEHGDIGYLKDVIEQVKNALSKDDFDKEKISQSQQNVKDYAQAEILQNTKTNDLYYKASEAVAQYNEALVSGEGVEEAKKNLDAVQTEVENAYGENGILKDINGAKYVFNDLWNEVSEGATKASNDTKNSFSDSRTKMISSINDLSEGFESLDKIYASIKDKNPFDFKLLDDKNFKDTFSGLGETYANFIEQITSNSNDIDACKDAFNNLVSEWINKTGVLNNLTDENASLTVSMLKQMGVANAEEIVVQRLTASRIAEKYAINEETLATEESTKALADNVNAIIEEANAAGYTKEAIYSLIAQQTIFSNTNLSVEGKINQLKNLAIMFGTVADAAIASRKAIEYSNYAANEKMLAYRNGDTASLSKIDSSYTDYIYGLFNLTDSSLKYDYQGGSTSNKGGSGGGQSEKEFNWIETLLSRIQNKISDLGKTVSATWKSWTDRNSALKSQISAVSQEISLQQQAISKYESLAGSLGLSSNYQNLVKNGALDISTITDDNLADKISKYQDYYEKIISAEDAIQDLRDELANLARTEFDNVAKRFDDQINDIEQNIGILESYINQTETKGYLVSKNYYSSMITEETKSLELLRRKYDELSDKLSNGVIEQGSEEWYAMLSEIKDVKQEIIETTTALTEYQNTINELDWEVFELIEDRISNITEESEFLIDLLSNSKLFNDDGSITSQGQATLGLHAVNYHIYMAQADDYANKVTELNDLLANDKNNQTLLDKKQEYIELQRESILAAENEKQSLKDLWSDGYSTLIDYMQELIDKRLELLQTTKDLYDYEKNVSEQTENIARLQKILNSYQGDDSEETKASIQKYVVELKEAEENLEQTEYERYISDQKQLFNNLMDDVEEWQNQRLDNLDGLIMDLIASTNDNAGSIKETLENEADDVGYTLSQEMQNIWNGTDGIKSVVSIYGDNFTSGINTVNETLQGIKTLVEKMAGVSDKEADTNIKDTTATTTPSTPPSTSTPTTPPSTSNNSSTPTITTKAITVGGKINASGALIYDYAGDTSGERQYYRNDPYYTVLAEKNGYLKVRHHRLSSGTTGWFKKSDVKAYKTGGLVDYTGLAWVDGQKGKPEAFLNANQTELFEKLKDSLDVASKNNLFKNIQSYAKLPSFVHNGNTQGAGGDVIFEKIEMYGVNDPQEFARQLKEVYDRDIGSVRKMINTDVHSKHGSQNYRRYL